MFANIRHECLIQQIRLLSINSAVQTRCRFLIRHIATGENIDMFSSVLYNIFWHILLHQFNLLFYLSLKRPYILLQICCLLCYLCCQGDFQNYPLTIFYVICLSLFIYVFLNNFCSRNFQLTRLPIHIVQHKLKYTKLLCTYLQSAGSPS